MKNQTTTGILTEGASIQPLSRKGLRHMSRRRLLTLSLGVGVTLAGGIGGVAFWRHLSAPRVIQRLDEVASPVAWSPDGQRFVAGDASGNVTVWTRDGTRISRQQKLDQYAVSSLTWSPNGQYLTAGGDGFVHLWHAQSGLDLATYPRADRSLAWSPESTRIASGNESGEIQIWQAASGRVSLQVQAYNDVISPPIDSLAWSPDGLHLAAIGPEAGDAPALWDTTTGKATALPWSEGVVNRLYSAIRVIAWSPDGRSLAAGYAADRDIGRLVFWSLDESTRAWKHLRSVDAHVQTVNGLAWAPDSAHLASVGEDHTMHIWRASTGELLTTYTSDWSGGNLAWWGVTEGYALRAVAWSPDGQYLLTGDNVGQVLLWNVQRAEKR